MSALAHSFYTAFCAELMACLPTSFDLATSLVQCHSWLSWSPVCRAVVVVGDDRGQVGVGCSSAKEVVQAVAKAVVAAKNELVKVPLTRNSTFPHRIDGYFGAAKVMLRPAAEGTGVIAGGAVRVVLELAGVKNAFGKQLGSSNPLNNARAALEGLSQMRTLQDVAAQRDLTIEELMNRARGRGHAFMIIPPFMP